MVEEARHGLISARSSTPRVVLRAYPTTVDQASHSLPHRTASEPFRCVVTRTIPAPGGKLLILSEITSGIPRVGMRLTSDEGSQVTLLSMPGVASWDATWARSLAFEAEAGVDLPQGSVLSHGG